VTSCIGDSAAIYIMVVKFRNTIFPPPPQLVPYLIGGLRCQPIQKEHSPYLAEITGKAVHNVIYLWVQLFKWLFRQNIFTIHEANTFSSGITTIWIRNYG
jgi:hypothetical protein